ncbi:MAG: alpha-galactosidase [Lachnospiraceae bacterium]|nr:alpha-galactosidase [Lachnospiraceae bacterium]
MEYIKISENGINIVYGITEEGYFKLLHFSKAPFEEKKLYEMSKDIKEEDRIREKELAEEIFEPVQLKLSGYDSPCEKHGNKHIFSSPGYILKYTGMDDTRNEKGRHIKILLEDKNVTSVKVETELQFYDGVSVVRMFNTVTNTGKEKQTLEDISSFLYFGIEKEGDGLPEDKIHIRVPYNGWQKEMTILDYDLDRIGFSKTQPGVYQRTSMVYEVTNTGNWSTKKYLPLGYIGNREADTALFFQIEHNGSWHYEIGDQNGHYYIYVSGPNETQSHWFKDLEPGESFTSVPVAAGVSKDSFEEALGELTRYRRLIRRRNSDNENLPVIFNDYMNCLFGDPTTEKEFPLIDAAAECGCEYFVIDAGWYSKGLWWDNVGEWKESRERFPNGIKEVTDHIKKRGMVPGVWLELEVMGINSEIAKKAPDNWFFVRHGKRVYDRSRFQLDFRNPEVREYITAVVDRVVNEYGAGYIKLDYNIEPGIGTELYADSVGDGLLGHERAYLEWLDMIFEKYPGLVIENCSSGGLRIDYALLARYSIQSTSDQEDYRNYATIAANCSAGVTPEQAAIWSYPMNRGKDDPEEVIYNMVNALLVRIHQSGHLAMLPELSMDLIKEGIALYKRIRKDIREGLPFLPMDVANNRDKWLTAGLKAKNKIYLAVWKRDMEGKIDNRLNSSEEINDRDLFCIPLDKELLIKDVRQVYPDPSDSTYPEAKISYRLCDTEEGMYFNVRMEKDVCARLFEFECGRDLC